MPVGLSECCTVARDLYLVLSATCSVNDKAEGLMALALILRVRSIQCSVPGNARFYVMLGARIISYKAASLCDVSGHTPLSSLIYIHVSANLVGHSGATQWVSGFIMIMCGTNGLLVRISTQTKLRDQLESLRIQMLEVSEQLNALSLPAKLPPEILLEIFLTHAARVQKNQLDRVLSDGKRVGKVSSYYQWIHVAHVCRRWREVALSCTEFKAYHVFETWTVPYHTLFWGVDTRALGDIPHSIVYHQNTTDRCQRCVPRSLSELGLDHIDEFLPRIKHLAIIIEDDEGTQALWESLGVAAETLESLRIGLRGSSWVYHTKEFESRFTIPDRLFTSCTPRLRTLTMSYVSFSWSNTLLCSSLQHLEITGHPGHEPTTEIGRAHV